MKGFGTSKEIEVKYVLFSESVLHDKVTYVHQSEDLD